MKKPIVKENCLTLSPMRYELSVHKINSYKIPQMAIIRVKNNIITSMYNKIKILILSYINNTIKQLKYTKI